MMQVKKNYLVGHRGYWRTCRYADSWTGQLADWTACRLVIIEVMD